MVPPQKSSCFGMSIKTILIIVAVLIVLGIVARLLPRRTALAPTAQPAAILVASPTPAPTAAPVAATRCLDVPAATLKAIEAGLKVDGGGTLDATTAKAVQSKDFKKAFFVAAAIRGAGMGDAGQVGVWTTNDLAGGQGMIYAVNAMAVEFSGWGDGSKTKAAFSMTSDGASDAALCVGS